jgi:hypothetical protein
MAVDKAPSSPLLDAIKPSAKDAAKKVKDPKKQPKRKAGQTTKGESPMAQTGQQHGELGGAKMPSPQQQMKQDIKSAARGAKVHATRQWVMGELSNKQHDGIHARADRVLSTGTAKPSRPLPKGW